MIRLEQSALRVCAAAAVKFKQLTQLRRAEYKRRFTPIHVAGSQIDAGRGQ